MNTDKLIRMCKVALIGATVAAAAGCSSWDSMNTRQKSTAGGAAIGGVAGAVISGGSVLGTVGGAAIGGIIGDQVGK